jgi:hypothetical protein
MVSRDAVFDMSFIETTRRALPYDLKENKNEKDEKNSEKRYLQVRSFREHKQSGRYFKTVEPLGMLRNRGGLLQSMGMFYAFSVPWRRFRFTAVKGREMSHPPV